MLRSLRSSFVVKVFVGPELLAVMWLSLAILVSAVAMFRKRILVLVGCPGLRPATPLRACVVRSHRSRRSSKGQHYARSRCRCENLQRSPLELDLRRFLRAVCALLPDGASSS